MRRVLIISQAERDAVNRLVEFASKDKNIYRPHLQIGWFPGRDPRYIVRLGPLRDFRCVFSVTESDFEPGVFWRHLSISVASAGYPHPLMVEEIAQLFGFTGTLADWIGGPNEAEHCVVIAQRMSAPAPS